MMGNRWLMVAYNCWMDGQWWFTQLVQHVTVQPSTISNQPCWQIWTNRLVTVSFRHWIAYEWRLERIHWMFLRIADPPNHSIVTIYSDKATIFGGSPSLRNPRVVLPKCCACEKKTSLPTLAKSTTGANVFTAFRHFTTSGIRCASHSKHILIFWRPKTLQTRGFNDFDSQMGFGPPLAPSRSAVRGPEPLKGWPTVWRAACSAALPQSSVPAVALCHCCRGHIALDIAQRWNSLPVGHLTSKCPSISWLGMVNRQQWWFFKFIIDQIGWRNLLTMLTWWHQHLPRARHSPVSPEADGRRRRWCLMRLVNV